MTPTLEHLLTRSATLVLRVAVDPTDPDAELEAVDGDETSCELQQTNETDGLDGRVQSTTWRLWLPAGVELTGWDAVRVDGELFELEGDPWPVRNPRTSVVSHVEARVRRVR